MRTKFDLKIKLNQMIQDEIEEKINQKNIKKQIAIKKMSTKL